MGEWGFQKSPKIADVAHGWSLIWLFFPKMGHISPTTLRIEVVEILFFEVTRNLKDQALKKENLC